MSFVDLDGEVSSCVLYLGFLFRLLGFGYVIDAFLYVFASFMRVRDWLTRVSQFECQFFYAAAEQAIGLLFSMSTRPEEQAEAIVKHMAARLFHSHADGNAYVTILGHGYASFC